MTTSMRADAPETTVAPITIREREREQIERANASNGDAGRLHPRAVAAALELGPLGRAVRGGRVRRADAGLAG